MVQRVWGLVVQTRKRVSVCIVRRSAPVEIGRVYCKQRGHVAGDKKSGHDPAGP